MIWALALCAMLWGLGGWMKATTLQRWLVVGAAWAAAFFWFGVPGNLASDDAKVWALITLIGAILAAYRRGLRHLRARARPVEAPAAPAPSPAPGAFAPEELERYARHILLREIGGPGQKAMKKARVLVIGAGGLGSPSLLYLAAAGVGTIGVVDDDVVDTSNLQRQVIHRNDAVGRPKVESAAEAMAALNPFVTVVQHRQRFDESCAALLVDYDLILDGSDNFDTRYLVNRLAANAGKPLVSAAITQWEGQISLFDPAHGTPCYECIFPHRPAPGMVPTCAEAGVAAPLPGILGSMMAMEAVKHLTGAGEGLRGRLMIYDALYGEARVINLKKREDCAVCGAGH